MEQIMKAAEISRQEVSSEDLALINKQALRELTQEEVFTFRLAACDNQVDRDFEQFTDEALDGLAPMFVGKSVLMDHVWCAGCQTARVYASYVEKTGSVSRLMLKCYMPRSDDTAKTINYIETGIFRECSVGCQVERAVCNICGADQAKICCAHVPGREYDGKVCVMALDGAEDAYEVSLVAVPSQRGAGVVKSKRYGGQEIILPDPKSEKEPKSIMEKLAAIAASTIKTERKE